SATRTTSGQAVGWTIKGYTGDPSGITCTVTEDPIPDGYTASGDPAGTCEATLAEGECEITNTLKKHDFTFTKIWSDSSNAEVTVTLSCTGGTIAPDTEQTTSDLGASWTVSGYTGEAADVSCTVTED